MADIRIPPPQAALEMLAAGTALLAVLLGGLLLIGQLAATGQRGGAESSRLADRLVGLLLALGAAVVAVAAGSAFSAGATELLGRMPRMLGWP